MGRFTLVGIVAAGALVLAACGTPEVTVHGVSREAPVGITVSGEGEVLGTPDTLTMSFGVSVLRHTVDEAVSDAAALADQLIAALEAEGVAEEDIQTANYSIRPEYDYSQDTRRLIGYRVDNSVIAKIRDLDSAGNVIDAAARSAGDEIQVSGLAFSIDDDEDLIEAARAVAWADAEAKAQQLAALSGTTLGVPLSITETLRSQPPGPRFVSQAVAEDAAATPIEPGRQAVTVDLIVNFAIGT